MYLLTPPSSARIQAFLAQQSCLPFSYAPVGATYLQSCQVPGYLPKGYVIDHNRTLLGHGEAAFIKARAALRAWRMFAIDWVDPFLYPAVLAEDTAVAILARLTIPLPLPSLWSLNAARIIYILDQSGPVERYGFAYGTLPDHAEQGEERFSVEWHHRDDTVWYDILAFSRPNQTLTRLGYPVARGWQRRFAAASLAAMRQAVLSP
ncbi:MAG: DUF1990 domain-containing protein [Candidatus Competibacteraceae bacterium]